jgi:hypothetical protein
LALSSPGKRQRSTILVLNSSYPGYFVIFTKSNATKLLKPNEKPKQKPPKTPLYNIIYDLTTLFKENMTDACSHNRKPPIVFVTQ